MEEDFRALPARLEVRSSSPDRSSALVTVREGKFHQIKRMFKARGREVTYLKRLSMGPLVLDETLLPGQWRRLTEVEIHSLKGEETD